MERDINDVNQELTSDQLYEMEENRVKRLNEAGIDEQLVLSKSEEHANIWNSYFQENITRGKDDVNFCIRDQWTAVERSEFTRLFKPAMTFNKLYDTTKKVVGEQRKNRPDLMVRALNGKATQDEITMVSDILRGIAYKSQNDLVYQTAFKSALMLGYGAFQVCLDYQSPMSFNKTIRYDIIIDPTTCGWDPTALMPHKGDGNWCSRRFVLRRDEFFATYPYVTNPISFIDPYMLLDFQWNTRDTIVINDEYVKEWYPLLIYKLSNGDVVTKEEWKKREKNFEDNMEIVRDSVVGEIIKREIPKIVAERQTQDYRIMHYRMLRDQIIDFDEWPSKQLPIPFVDGDSYYIEGRQYTKSFIHEARDAQKLLNYDLSELAAELKNRRREQWVGTPENISGFEQEWRNPELQMAMLRARPDPKTGLLPQKMPAWEISQGLFLTAQTVNQTIREVLGFSEMEALQGRDMSGKARRERKMEGSMSSYVFFNNLDQSIAQGGRIVLDLLPYVIGNEEQDVSVISKDGSTRSITVNQKIDNDTVKNKLPNVSDFDIEIDTGPSFAVQKEMALEFFQQTIAAFPQAFPLIADLWVSNLDIEQMPVMKERFKTIVPPEILAKEEGKPIPPKQPNPQDQLMQMEMAEKAAALKERAHELQIREQKHELEKAKLLLDAREMEEKFKNDKASHSVELHKAELSYSSQLAKTLADLHKHLNPQKKSENG